MQQEVMIKKVYAAGILNYRDNWEWQGTVVSSSIAKAKKLLSQFRKESGISGRCEVIDMDGHYTNRPEGVSDSTQLF